MEKVVIFGGTGFIGLSLANHLYEKGMKPVLVARNSPKKSLNFSFVPWDSVTLGEWVQELNGARAIVNLAGRTVDCIKTPDHCDVILRSRVDSTKTIGAALKEIENKPSVWIQMAGR